MVSKIQVSELDFESIKNNIKAFLSTKSEFTDYDFNGSAMSVIIDVLAYNTYYNSVYMNMMFNESYLDTAVKRSNVISNASDIGYTPRSVTSPKSQISVSLPISANGDSQIVFPKGTKFSTTVNGTSYTYTTVEDYISTTPHSNFEMIVYEGRLHTRTINVTADVNQKFILGNTNVDTKQVSITVNGDTYNTIDDLLTVTGDSKIFLMREINGFVEIIFGDGTIGAPVETGDTIVINYLTTTGADSNKASVFTPNNSVGGYAITVNSATLATGGSYPETIESIKYLAPLSYASQNRMVTKEDHIVILKRLFTNIESISVWGGEESLPARYGSVFVSIKPIVGDTLTSLERANVLEILNKYGIMTTTYFYQDPEFTYIKPTIQIKYDPTKTSQTKNDIITKVTNTVVNYGNNVLEKFLTYFRYSDFLTSIDNVDESISSNLTKIKIEKREVITNIGADIIQDVVFGNEITPNSVSTQYYRDEDFDSVTIFDDGLGNLKTRDVNDIVKRTVGTVDYENGVLKFTKLHVRSFDNGDVSLNFTVTPIEFDIIPLRNQILLIDNSQIEVNIENVR